MDAAATLKQTEFPILFTRNLYFAMFILTAIVEYCQEMHSVQKWLFLLNGKEWILLHDIFYLMVVVDNRTQQAERLPIIVGAFNTKLRGNSCWLENEHLQDFCGWKGSVWFAPRILQAPLILKEVIYAIREHGQQKTNRLSGRVLNVIKLSLFGKNWGKLW